MRTSLLALAAGALLATAAHAEPVKIGMITTLSGPGSGLGIDIRDGFQLALDQQGGTLGGQEVEVIEGDDQRKPDVAKQLLDRMIERDEIDIVTGIVWSNLALALMPTVDRHDVFFISPNAGPSQLAGERCHPLFFNAAWQNDNQHEAMGKHVQDEGYASAVLLAPNYPAGKDAIEGFKRYFKGEVKDEIFTQLGQLDYAAELAQVRAADPEAVFFFYPGGMGINFVKQYEQAGLKGEIPVFGPGFSFSQDVLAAVGEAALGVNNTAQWSPDLDNEQNKQFVEAFEETYGRIPSIYASQGYDTALLIGAALESGATPDDTDAFREALETAEFDSVRGPFKFNSNHFPIQNFYLREVVKDEQGRLTNRIVDTVFENHADAYAENCQM